jgi:hypothetical protein
VRCIPITGLNSNGGVATVVPPSDEAVWLSLCWTNIR